MSRIILNKRTTIKESVKKLEKSRMKILFFTNKKKEIVGTLTDGDVRRAILNNVDLNSSVEKIVTKNFIFLNHDSSKNNILSVFKKKNITAIPLIKKNKLKKIVYRNEILTNKNNFSKEYKKFDVVIMAGGYGKRLLPLTKNIPKCLVNINKKNKIIDVILKKYLSFKLDNFLFITYHLSKKIENFLQRNYTKKLNFKIIREKKKLGTAGGLKYLKEIKTTDNVILTNSDVISNIDLDDLQKFHKKKNSDFTIVTKSQNLKLEFGQIKNLSESLVGIEEKPNIQYVVNAGIYIFNRKILKHVRSKIDIPDLINLLKRKKYKIKIYHLYENWFDIGTVQQLQYFKKNYKKF